MLKIEDQLRLQELQFYFKYIHKNLPAYLLDWKFISNVNIHLHDTRTSSKIHTVRTKHEFAKKWMNILSKVVICKLECFGCRDLPRDRRKSGTDGWRFHERVIGALAS